MQGKIYYSEVPMNKMKDIFNSKHTLYLANILKGIGSFEVLNISNQ
jgi:hypothetical protein